ncbi:hypothetical protein Q6D67_02265 [Haliea sp. E1-2-M8]|uniref:hypothetical protein n=1 Tax=Haliea sp. E1-2-M8 TaxID=3064706 RepID=UPI002719ED3F|nr:hypothetical protein [Haliea sp. E1-2-M8]MDO8860510.1 hypothetical protein [Haliea sp. E1-2-M8]
MRKLLALPALFLAAHTWASCPAPMPQEAPDIPNGQTASMEEMHAAREAVSEYVTGVEAYLNCRSASLHPLVHNRAVYLAETTADSWNNALHTFRQRDNMLATN